MLQTPSVGLAMSRKPAAAVRDVMEWVADPDPRRLWRGMLAHEVVFDVMAPGSTGVTITDDRPLNESVLLRRSLARVR